MAAVTPEAIERRKARERERYINNREERLMYQREYYLLHREQCRASVQRSKRKKFLKEYKEKWRSKELQSL